jgi:hypothetical protein
MNKVNVIDIGAVGGLNQISPWSKHIDKVGITLSFEPNDDSILIGKHLKYDCAVWNFDGVAEFHVYGKNGIGSSLLTQNFKWVKENFEFIKCQGDQILNSTWFDRSNETNHFQCQVKRLDTILAELEKKRGMHIQFHFLKSDTQSGEFFVLDAARQYLEHDCLGLDLELFRYPIYEGIILEDKVKSLLDDLGFEIAGWTGYQNSFLSQADYLFLRKVPRSLEEEKTINLIKNIYAPQGAGKIIKSTSMLERGINKIKRTYFNLKSR